jgi:thiol-disulfide isomerase/thioredoxin
MAKLSRNKATQAAVAALISVLIIGAAVTLAFVAGDGPGDSPTTLAGQAPETVGYVNYETPDKLLAGHAGRPLVINFFASWCAPCRAELPDLAAAHARWGDQVDFVGIAFQEASESAAAQLLFETGITYPIMEDPDGALLRELGTLPTMPTTIFVTADSVILERHHGLILSDQLDERIEEIIAGS